MNRDFGWPAPTNGTRFHVRGWSSDRPACAVAETLEHVLASERSGDIDRQALPGVPRPLFVSIREVRPSELRSITKPWFHT